MKTIFVSMFIFAFSVDMYRSQDETRRKIIKRDPFEYLEPFEPGDFENPPKFEDPNTCLIPNIMCHRSEKGKIPVCAHEIKYGLVSFRNVCVVYMQNCFAQPTGFDHVYGVPTSNDVSYFNGRNHTCDYYMKIAKTEDDAIDLYHILGYGNA